MNGPIIPFTPKNYKKNDLNHEEPKEKKDTKETESTKKEENNDTKETNKKQQINPHLFIPSMTPIANPIFLNQVQLNKNHYNKFQRKMKYFSGRTGDWTCNNCRNLNFAFRTVCNRCKLPKPETTEKKEPKGTNEKKKNNCEGNRNRFLNKNKYKNKKYYYNDMTNCKTEEEK